MKKIEELSLSTLANLYTIVSEICQDYARLTDGYALSTGDNKFENMPQDISAMTVDRNRFYGYKFIIMDLITKKIDESFKKNEFEE